VQNSIARINGNGSPRDTGELILFSAHEHVVIATIV